MYKVLFDSHDGEMKQKIVTGGIGLQIMDADIIWDERKDDWSQFDPAKLGGYKREGDALVFDQAKKDAHDLVANAKAAALQAAEDAKAARKAKIQAVASGMTLPQLVDAFVALREELGLDS